MSNVSPPRRLDSRNLRLGVNHLVHLDPDLETVIQRHGLPPLWPRRPGFATLVRIILEQQVTLASGAAMYGRLERHLGKLTPDAVLVMGVSGLRGLGITRQKAAYCIDLAQHVFDGTLNLKRLTGLSDRDAQSELQRVKGIGPWTSQCYLLMALRRPDVWPTGDIALQTAVQTLRRLPKRPTSDQAAEIALRWKPWRSVAARILWHGYLEGALRISSPR